ncbi:MAG: protein kinase, partial [Planctomycetes bacterium]|nr:protein kinase [Planctomycetota bacterium]
RDLKPENVMITRAGRVKLTDLGLARHAVDDRGTTLIGQTAVVMGTPQYMPPEQWETPYVKAPADVWALGATFHFLVTGRHAVPPGSPGKVAHWIYSRELPSLRDQRPDWSPVLHAAYERCVRRDPARRFATAGELLAALRDAGPVDEAALQADDCQVVSTAEIPGAAERVRLQALVAARSRPPSGRRSRRRLQAVALFAAALLVAGAVWIAAPVRDALGATAAADRDRLGLPLARAERALAQGDEFGALAALARAGADDREAAGLRHRIVERRRLRLVGQLSTAIRVLEAQQDGSVWVLPGRELLLGCGELPAGLRRATVALGARGETFATAALRPGTLRLALPHAGPFDLRVLAEERIGVRVEVSIAIVRSGREPPAAPRLRPVTDAVLAGHARGPAAP